MSKTCVDIDNDLLEQTRDLLASRARHRLPIVDLVTAAAAVAARMPALRYNADFDTIATMTGQDVEWVVPRGSL